MLSALRKQGACYRSLQAYTEWKESIKLMESRAERMEGVQQKKMDRAVSPDGDVMQPGS